MNRLLALSFALFTASPSAFAKGDETVSLKECQTPRESECSASSRSTCEIDYCSMVPYADQDMEDILNECMLDDTSGCSSWGSTVVTHTWYDHYGYCTYPAATLNAYIDNIADEADDNRPGNNYFIVDYQFEYLTNNSPYGYYYKHTVTYEKMICEAQEVKALEK